MRLAVKFYGEISERPAGIPVLWPALVIEEGQAGFHDVDSSWVVMTFDEYEKYRSQHQSEYDAWSAENVSQSAV